MVYPKHRITRQDPQMIKFTMELSQLQQELRLKTIKEKTQEEKLAALLEERNEFKDAYMEQLKKREEDLQGYTASQRTVEQCYQGLLLREKFEYQRLAEYFTTTVTQKDEEIKRLQERAAQFEKELDINEEEMKRLWKRWMDQQDVLTRQEEIIKEQAKKIERKSADQVTYGQTPIRAHKRVNLNDRHVQHTRIKIFRVSDGLSLGSEVEQTEPTGSEECDASRLHTDIITVAA